MSEFLDIGGVISFEEFVAALRHGQIAGQIDAIKAEKFGRRKFGAIILESVKIDSFHNGFRIIPSFRIGSYQNSTKSECYLIKISNFLTNKKRWSF